MMSNNCPGALVRLRERLLPALALTECRKAMANPFPHRVRLRPFGKLPLLVAHMGIFAPTALRLVEGVAFVHRFLAPAKWAGGRPGGFVLTSPEPFVWTYGHRRATLRIARG